MKQYQITTSVHYKDEAPNEWHYGITALGTWAEMRAEMKRIRHGDYAGERWRRIGDTVGFTNRYVTRTFVIEQVQS